MISPFLLSNNQQVQPMHLERFPPAQVNRSLQAWDGADEFLVNHVSDNALINESSNILIFNDSFGALALNFSAHNVYQVSDSYVAQQGTLHNFQLNGLNIDKLTLLTSLDELPPDVDLILYKIPKSKSFLLEQLSRIQQKYDNKVVFIAADKAKLIQKNTLRLFEQYLGTTTTSLAIKKARLVFCTLTQQSPLINLESTLTWQTDSPKLTICNLANVFAREKLDIGGRAFIEQLPDTKGQAQVIDLGCGNGVVGLSMLAKCPTINLTFVDESFMAVKSAETNVRSNFPALISQCLFKTDDCLTSFDNSSADIILCNPPFHQQNAVTDHIAWQMFKDSYRVLRKGGELRIVGNRQLGYHIKLQRLFGNCKTIASNNKFVILSAIKK